MGAIQRAKINRADLGLWDGGTKTITRPDATSGTVTELTVGEEVDILQVYGAGTNRTLATLSNAVQRVGSSVVCFLIGTGTWLITDDITVPSTISCRIAAGCTLLLWVGRLPGRSWLCPCSTGWGG